ncbi:MAG: pyrroline-5-carboxylate reductase family protein, partial [Nitrospirales bacterium]
MRHKQKIAFLGAGNMAEALIAGLLNAEIVQADSIFATDISKERLDHLKKTYQVHVGSSNEEA